METINIKREDLNKLHSKKTNIYNSESNLYYHNKYVIKIFKNDYIAKKNTLLLLSKYKRIIQRELSNLVLPIKLINVDNEFKGYTMNMYVGTNLTNILNNNNVPFDHKINYLIELGKVLDKMEIVRNNYPELFNFYLNDLHEDNIFITHDNKLKIIDIDSVKIGNNQTFKSLYLNQPYHSKLYNLNNKYNINVDCINPNKESDLLCYIYIIINFLVGKNISKINYNSFKYYINKLNEQGVNKELINIFLNIYQDRPNINPAYYLKNGTKKLLH